MRQLRSFTTGDLVATAEIGESLAQKYVLALQRAGYLAVLQPKRSGVTGGHAQYRLVRNTGPVAPRINQDGIFDANLADPYQISPSKLFCKHASAMHKALRELVDVYSRSKSTFHQQNVALTAARAVLSACDGGEA